MFPALDVAMPDTCTTTRYYPEAFAQESGTTFVPLVMEANGGWLKCGQRYVNRVALHYAMRIGVTAVAAVAAQT